MKNRSVLASVATIFLLFLHFLPTPVFADNCSGLSDCFRGNMVPAILLILGLLVLIGLLTYFGGWAAIGVALRGLIGWAARSRIIGAMAGLGAALRRLFGKWRNPPRPPAKPPQPPPKPPAPKPDMNISPKQLQKKYKKHAKDFGLEGNYNPANGKRFEEAIRKHMGDPATREIEGTLHRRPVTHYYNPNTGLNVVKNPDGSFVSGWKLSPGQTENLLRSGNLGGG